MFVSEFFSFVAEPDEAANEKTISVKVDGQETTLQFIDLDPETQEVTSLTQLFHTV